MDEVIITYSGYIEPEWVEGKTFQVHVLPDNKLRLYLVTLDHDERCPVIIKGERCGLKAGHEGKHMWGSGD